MGHGSNRGQYSRSERDLYAVNLRYQGGGPTGTGYYNDIDMYLGSHQYEGFARSGTTVGLVNAWKKAYSGINHKNPPDAQTIQSSSNLGAALLYDLNYAFNGVPPAKKTNVDWGQNIPGIVNAAAPAPLLNYIQQRAGSDASTMTSGYLSMMQQSPQYASYCAAYFLATGNWGRTKEHLMDWIRRYNKHPNNSSKWPNDTPAGYPVFNTNNHLFNINTASGPNIYSDTVINKTPVTVPLGTLSPAQPPPPPLLFYPFLFVVGGAVLYFYWEK